MENQAMLPEVTFQHHTDDATFKKRVMKTTILLSVITLVELGIGLTIYTMHKGENPNHTLILMFKGMVCILTLAKAYYIVSVFMHLGDEIRNMIMTVVVPLMLFIWFIIAFIYDGKSYNNLRNTYDKSYYERTGVKREIKKEEQHSEKPGGKD
jgi:cytochrome c oxidase subunit IV